MSTILKHVGFSVVALVLLSRCNGLPEEETPVDESPGDIRVNKLLEIGDDLYAATDDGVYRARFYDEDHSWEHVGLDDHYVSGMVQRPDGELLAGIRDAYGEYEGPPLFLSENNRSEFVPYPQNYGEGYDGQSIVYTMSPDPFRPETVYARGPYHAARSTDSGESWELIFGDWGSAGYQADIMEVHPLEPETIWVGGETSIFSPYLLYSENQGESWQAVEPEYEGDDAAYSLAFHPDDPDQLMLGMEGEIKYTADRGESWETVFENDYYHYIHDMKSPGGEPAETVYAAGTENGAQGGGLYFLKTEDFGRSWDKVKAEEGLENLSINDLLVRRVAGEDVIYFATSQGVWKYENGSFSRIS